MEYDYLASFYDAFIDEEVYEQYIDYISKYSSVGSVLDIGCGTGNLSIQLAKLGYNVVATDLSENMLHIVSQRAQNEGLEIEVGVYDMLDPIEYEFDLIIASMDVINHLSDLEDVEFGFTNIYNSLKENGVFIFDVLSVEFIDAFDGYEESDEDYQFHWSSKKGDKPHSIIHTIRVEHFEEPQEIQIYEQTHEYEAYEKILKKVGFHIVDTRVLPERKIYVVQKQED
jgi:2-polyprenyl-3-methyl-5-hydroxy-6-metoxy-1,4-benzoquinol methylase